jgi:glucose-1-phosphate adenylyltransferase
VRILTPYKARGAADWYVGTADAVQQNFLFIKPNHPDLILILSGDHIYEMNYDPLIAFHQDHNADVTMATIRVPISDASRFGIVGVSEDYRVTSFIEKPRNPPSNLVNMGVYLFNLDVLDRELWQDHQRAGSSHDFGKDILPSMVQSGRRVFAYPYTGYWVDVGTIHSYWQAHMDLLVEPPALDLNDRSWIVHTRTEERPPVRIARSAMIADSMLADGCMIEAGAVVERSVLAPGVRVRSGALLRESVILTESEIEENAVVERTILDKRARVCQGAQVGFIEPGSSVNITTVGKNSVIPSGMRIEAGATIATDVVPEDYSSPVIGGEEYIQTKRQPYEV